MIYNLSTKTISIFEYNNLNICGILDEAGPTVLIQSPGLNQHIVVTSFVIQNEASQASTLMILQDGGHDRWRFLAPAQGDFLSKDFAPNHPWKLRDNQPLVLYLSAANQCSYSIQYHIE